jgi:glycosyltransferase involved in cell wall biosynthesis
MHILIIPSWYKTPHTPFMGTFFEEQARALMNAGHCVGILYPEFVPFRRLLDTKHKAAITYNDNGLPTCIAPVQILMPSVRTMAYQEFNRKVNHHFHHYIKRHGLPDLIHAHSVFYAGIAGMFITQRYQLPFVITEHLTSYVMGTITHEKDLQIARSIFSRADASLVVSHCYKKDLACILQLNEDVFDVVPNMVNGLFFEGRFVKSFHPNEPFVLFTNSFLLPRKNHRLILQAIGELKKKGVNVHLRIGGYGQEEEALKKLTSELNLQDSVVFLGGLDRQQVKHHIDHSHAFILASFYETFGVVLIESLAAGRPVISTQSGGAEEIITTDNGILVPDFSVSSMAEAIETMMKEYSRFDQMAISNDCYARFNEKKIISRLEQIYQQVLEKRSKAKAQISDA